MWWRFRVYLAFLPCVVVSMAWADAELARAVGEGDIEGARIALTAGSDPDAQSNMLPVLSLAALRGDEAMIALLLDAGADPDKPNLLGANALSVAIRGCRANEPIVRMLVDAGADLEDHSGDGLTPLMLAVQEERIDTALLLLELGADVNTLNPYGEGVLNYAIYVKSPPLINAFLDRGVDMAPMRKLFTTVDYDPPGIGQARAHHEVLCD